MANIKFSQFTPQTDYNNVADLVGYNGAVNVRITPVDLVQGYLSTNAISATVDGVFIGNNGSGTSSSLQIGKSSNFNSSINLNHDPLISGAGILSSTQQIQLRINTPTSRDVVNLTDGIGAIKTELTEIGDVNKNFGALTLQTDAVAGNTFEMRHNIGGNLIFENEINADLRIGVNGDISIDNSGTPLIQMQSPTRFNSDLEDTAGATGNIDFVLKSNGGGGSGIAWKRQQPGCQLKIAGTTGLGNTTDGIDFEVQYNATIVNDDPTIFTPQLIGGGGPNIGIQVLQDGRYEFFARYSTFDILQPGLPNVDGTKFLRIVAAVNGIKQCILQDLIVPTALNGEANVTGGGFMDLVAGDIFGIIGFHTGATGGAGNQGFPVSNNALFNEPMLWLVKID